MFWGGWWGWLDLAGFVHSGLRNWSWYLCWYSKWRQERHHFAECNNMYICLYVCPFVLTLSLLGIGMPLTIHTHTQHILQKRYFVRAFAVNSAGRGLASGYDSNGPSFDYFSPNTGPAAGNMRILIWNVHIIFSQLSWIANCTCGKLISNRILTTSNIQSI